MSDERLLQFFHMFLYALVDSHIGHNEGE